MRCPLTGVAGSSPVPSAKAGFRSNSRGRLLFLPYVDIMSPVRRGSRTDFGRLSDKTPLSGLSTGAHKDGYPDQAGTARSPGRSAGSALARVDWGRWVSARLRCSRGASAEDDARPVMGARRTASRSGNCVRRWSAGGNRKPSPVPEKPPRPTAAPSDLPPTDESGEKGKQILGKAAASVGGASFPR